MLHILVQQVRQFDFVREKMHLHALWSTWNRAVQKKKKKTFLTYEHLPVTDRI